MDFKQLSLSTLQSLALRFGVEVVESKCLYGLCDANYLVTGRIRNKDGLVDRMDLCKYILKIQIQDSICCDKEIAKVLEHLHNKGFIVTLPLIVLPTDELSIKEITIEYPVHMYKYIEGKTVFDESFNSVELKTLAWNLGYFGGTVTECLQEIPFKLDEVYQVDPTHPESVWIMQHAAGIREYLDCIKDVELKVVIGEFLDLHEDLLQNKISELRRGFIHGDFNDTNIILKDRRAVVSRLITIPDDVKKIFGIIDFETVHCSWIIFELAIMMSYMLIKCEGSGTEPNAIVREVIAGFQSVVPLSDREKDALYCSVGVRLAASVVHVSHMITLEPERSNEISIHASKCPRILKALSKAGKDETMKVWLS